MSELHLIPKFFWNDLCLRPSIDYNCHVTIVLCLRIHTPVWPYWGICVLHHNITIHGYHMSGSFSSCFSGEMKWADGRKYVGHFKEGLQHG